MNRVTSTERKKPAVKQASYVNRLVLTDAESGTTTLSPLIPSKVNSKLRVRSNYPIPQKDSDMSRGGTVSCCRKQAHNPRPRTTGVGPATINVVDKPLPIVQTSDFLLKIHFDEGF